ncbi:aldehyde dehydrogenase [Mycobacterium syngnathidarum]
MTRTDLLIDGEWRKALSARRIPVVSPSTGQVIGEVADANPADVDAAVQAASRAFDAGSWRSLEIGERARILERALAILEPRLDRIQALVTAEMGLPTSVARVQIPGALATGRYFLEVARSRRSHEIRHTSSGPTAVVEEPVGVVASISPWNGPFNMAVAKVVPALISGCSMVYKPAPETPLDGFLLAEALVEAGVPPGVFNYVTGDRDAGRAMVSHPLVDKVSFTGSTAAGREIGRECGAGFKRMQLELGGKSAAIVLDDADIATTTAALAMGAFFNTGQVCMAFSRVLVPKRRYDEFTAALVGAAEAMTVGDPFDEATTMGPLVSARQQQRVLEYVDIGRSEGATVATGGGVPEGLEGGAYVQPTVLTGTSNSMRVAREEIFGPVASLLSYDSLDEAIAIANDSDYGLHGGVFTTDPHQAVDVARRVRSGTFSINSFTYNIEAPFGGVKNSGVGRDTGPEAIQSYYELKTINMTEDTAALLTSPTP